MFNKVTVNIGGKERTLNATLGNVHDIELALGQSIFSVLKPLFNGDSRDVSLTFNQIADIISIGLRGLPTGGMTKGEVSSCLLEDGYMAYFEPCLAFLLACVSGSKDPDRSCRACANR
jgi:hypothetical protein